MNRVFTEKHKYYFKFIALLVLSLNNSLPTMAQGMNFISPYQYSAPPQQSPYQYPTPNTDYAPPVNNSPQYPLQSTTPTSTVPLGIQPLPTQSPASALTPALIHQAADLTNQAYRLTKEGNNEQAIELLNQALAIDPSSSIAHLNMSVALIALKRYDEALKESSIVLQLTPDEEKGYLNYLAAAIGANHMQDALRVGQEYLNRFPNGHNRTTLSNEVVAVAQEIDRRAKARGVLPPPGAPDNYLFLSTPNGRRRWAPYMMPIKVYIYPGQNYKGFLPSYEATLIGSFMAWQNASRGLMRFIPVSDASQSNIECRWTDSLKDVSLAAEAGDAQIIADRRTNTINHVIITLLTCRPDIPSERLSLNLMQQVCLHEIGHALGLEGHSDSAQDIMYCATDPNVEHVGLSQRDLNTLFLLYQQPF